MASKKTPKEESNSNVVHVRIDKEKALYSKKQILASEISILKFVKGVGAYLGYRKRELELREELKKESRKLNDMITKFLASLPKYHEREKTKIKDDLESINKRESLELDLDQIKKKLYQLGGL